MAKKNRTVIYLEFFIVKLFMFVVSLMSWNFAHKFGIILSRICSFLLASRTGIMRENLRMAFPEMPEKKINDLSRKVWENLGQTLVEFVKIPQINADNVDRFVEFRGLDNLIEGYKNKTGLIFLVAHYYNWELMGKVVSMLGYPLAVIARPLDNPKLDELTNRIRSSSGAKVIPKKQAIKEGVKFLRNGGGLAILIDQHYGNDISVNFFGRKAETSPIISALYNKLNSIIIPIKSHRAGYKIIIEASPGIRLPVYQDKIKARQEGTQKLSDIIEGWIRERPEGWLWVHRRWR